MLIRMNEGNGPIYDLEYMKRIIIQVISTYDVDRAYIFGSYARGDRNENSDVDIRIDADKLRTFDLCGLTVRLERALEREVEVIPTDCMSKEFLDSIREEEVMVYER